MRRRQHGAALLLAMVILTLVATLAAGMVWQQSRSVQIEAAERSAAQSEWILTGALDWARLILREDTRSGGADHLGEPWATPLAEARLSTFLAADRDNNTDGGPEAFLSGSIVDAQSRYNLRNLVDAEGKIVEAELKGFDRLCDAIGLPTDAAQRIAAGLKTACAPGTGEAAAAAPIAPQRVEQLAWLGIDAPTIAALLPYVSLLPVRTAVNANTAAREVLLAAVDNLDLATAERLVQARQRAPYKSADDIRKELPEGMKIEDARLGFRSSYFDVYGRLRLEDRVIEQHSLVERRGADRGLDVVTLLRERRNLLSPAG
jgi:general secretion pathway protein K